MASQKTTMRMETQNDASHRVCTELAQLYAQSIKDNAGNWPGGGEVWTAPFHVLFDTKYNKCKKELIGHVTLAADHTNISQK